MDALIDVAQIQAWLDQGITWVRGNVFVISNLVQVVAVFSALAVARLMRRSGVRLIEQVSDLPRVERYRHAVRRIATPLVLPVFWWLLMGLAALAAVGAAHPRQIIGSVQTLLTAWIVIRLAATFIATPFWQRAVTMTAWGVAALNIVGLLEPAMAVLDSMALHMGAFRLSVLDLLQAAVLLIVLLWGAGATARLLERRIRYVPNLSPSAQVLIGKMTKIVLVVLAVLVTLNSVGIDLTALAVFTGAIGLGLGFGLQKVVSNLISGMILLLDRSVKPGDVIAIGTTYGWINALGARYVSVITRDGVEHLIPNEELISTPVENWSYTDRRVRQRLPLGVSYGSDLKLAIELILQAAGESDRLLKDPAPTCLVRGFGESQIDLELRVWIEDAEKGLSNFKSQIYLRIWDLFHEQGVEFPYRQTDLHIKSAVPLTVKSD